MQLSPQRLRYLIGAIDIPARLLARTSRAALIACIGAGLALAASAADSTREIKLALPTRGEAEAYVPKQSDRPAKLTGDEPGFTPIFDGQTLAGWEGDPSLWRVEAGSIVGETTDQTGLKSNTFIIWRGGQPKDFELKLEYRVTPLGNSGINYRSTVVADAVVPSNRFALRGYQCDLDGRNRYTGNNYEEKGRLFLALRGQLTRVVGGRPPVHVATIAPEMEMAKISTDGWNAVHILARGNVFVHVINGQVMSIVIDDDAPGRPPAGLIGMQVHVGPPMKIEYRDLRLKTF